jgi:hypothetical protein
MSTIPSPSVFSALYYFTIGYTSSRFLHTPARYQLALRTSRLVPLPFPCRLLLPSCSPSSTYHDLVTQVCSASTLSFPVFLFPSRNAYTTNTARHERKCVIVCCLVHMLGLGSVIWPTNIGAGREMWVRVGRGRSSR